MAWYNTGTIALTNGSATVTGSGTNFLVGAQIGEALYAPDGKLYEIQTINSATVITLASNYLGSTASGQDYQIIPTQSLVADLASDVTDLISDFADVRDYAGNGKFNDGAVGTPGITFTQDQDNGLYRIGSNNWALAAGGQQVVNLTTTAMNFPDNNKAIFGSGSDLQIYHDGSNSWIYDGGTGNLNIEGRNIFIIGANNDTNLAGFIDGAEVRLYYNGSQKLATTATGIDVTGTVTADGLTVEASAATANITSTSGGATLNLTHPTATDGYSIRQGNADANDFRIFEGSKIKLNINTGGDISFYEDTGTTAKFFWDASAESLGIGTTPATTLHVYDTINNYITLEADGATRYAGLVLKNSVQSWRVQTHGGDAGFKIHNDTTNNTALSIDTTGAATFSGSVTATGGVVFGDAGGSGTPASNTLEDYEEGTWTPAVTGSTTAGSATYTIQQGFYTKIGNVVHWNARIGYTGHTGTGNMLIFGLPFTTANKYAAGSYSFRDGLTLTAGDQLIVSIPPNNTYIGLYGVASGTDTTAALALDTAVSDLSINGVYTV